ncbi:MAG: seg, partial [Microgenomates group bacterium GW2011_GWC1_43_11]
SMVHSAVEWLLTAESGEKTLQVIELFALFGFQYVPEETFYDSTVLSAVEQFMNSPSSDALRELIGSFFHALVFPSDAGDAFGYSLSYYPGDIRDDLRDLYTKTNPQHQSAVDILSHTIDAYEESAKAKGETPIPVYWHKHPDALKLQDIASQISYGDMEYLDQYPLSDDLDTIQTLSDNAIESYTAIASLYASLHPEIQDEFVTEDAVRSYFSDYFGFIFSQYQDTHQPLSISDLLAYALEKNRGDMHGALWDATIAVKLLTRNDVNSGEYNGDYYSGWLTIMMLQDPFSFHYTARDLAQLLPASKYWNFDYGDESVYMGVSETSEGGDKDFDPANIAGMQYHTLNLWALQGEFPVSVPVAGLFKDWFLGSYQESEYGWQRLREQIRYMQENAGSMALFLDNLPDSSQSEERFESGTVIFVDPWSEWLIRSEKTDSLRSHLADGDIVAFADSGGVIRYAMLQGSVIQPYIRIAGTAQEAARPFHPSDFTAHQVTDNPAAIFWGVQVTGVFKRPDHVPPIIRTFDTDVAYQVIRSSDGVPMSVDPSQAQQLFDQLRNSVSTPEESVRVRERIVAYPQIFAPLMTPDDLQWLLGSDWKLAWKVAETFLSPNGRGWSEYVTIEDIFAILRQYDDAKYAIASQTPLFASVMTPDDVRWILSDQLSANYFLNSYSIREDLRDYFSPEDIFTALKQTDRIDLIGYYPQIFAPFISHDDLEWLLSSPESAFKFLLVYNNGEWDTLFSVKEVSQLLYRLYPDDYPYYLEMFPSLETMPQEQSFLLSSDCLSDARFISPVYAQSESGAGNRCAAFFRAPRKTAIMIIKRIQMLGKDIQTIGVTKALRLFFTDVFLRSSGAVGAELQQSQIQSQEQSQQIQPVQQDQYQANLTAVIDKALLDQPNLIKEGNIGGFVDFILKTDDYQILMAGLSPPEASTFAPASADKSDGQGPTVKDYSEILTILQPTLQEQGKPPTDAQTITIQNKEYIISVTDQGVISLVPSISWPSGEENQVSLFDLNEPDQREERFTAAMSLLPKLIQRAKERGYTFDYIIRLLNRLGSVTDDNFSDSSSSKGVLRSDGQEMGIHQADGSTWFAPRGGSEVGEQYTQFTQTLDTLLQDQKVDPYMIASWAFLELGVIHPFNEGNGRTQRLLVNYILLLRGEEPMDWSSYLDNGHLGKGTQIIKVMEDYTRRLETDFEYERLSSSEKFTFLQLSIEQQIQRSQSVVKKNMDNALQSARRADFSYDPVIGILAEVVRNATGEQSVVEQAMQTPFLAKNKEALNTPSMKDVIGNGMYVRLSTAIRNGIMSFLEAENIPRPGGVYGERESNIRNVLLNILSLYRKIKIDDLELIARVNTIVQQLFRMRAVFMCILIFPLSLFVVFTIMPIPLLVKISIILITLFGFGNSYIRAIQFPYKQIKNNYVQNSIDYYVKRQFKLYQIHNLNYLEAEIIYLRERGHSEQFAKNHPEDYERLLTQADHLRQLQNRWNNLPLVEKNSALSWATFQEASTMAYMETYQVLPFRKSDDPDRARTLYVSGLVRRANDLMSLDPFIKKAESTYRRIAEALIPEEYYSDVLYPGPNTDRIMLVTLQEYELINFPKNAPDGELIDNGMILIVDNAGKREIQRIINHEFVHKMAFLQAKDELDQYFSSSFATAMDEGATSYIGIKMDEQQGVGVSLPGINISFTYDRYVQMMRDMVQILRTKRGYSQKEAEARILLAQQRGYAPLFLEVGGIQVVRDIYNKEMHTPWSRIQLLFDRIRGWMKVLMAKKIDLSQGNGGSGEEKPPECVTGDTLLLKRVEGSFQPIRIDQIQNSDMVLTYDEDADQFVPQKVVQLLDKGMQETWILTTKKGKTIRTTREHPYLTKKGWIRVKDLRVREEIRTMDGWEPIQSLIQGEKEQVYDVEVEGTHTFVAGNYINTKTRQVLSREDREAIEALLAGSRLAKSKIQQEKSDAHQSSSRISTIDELIQLVKAHDLLAKDIANTVISIKNDNLVVKSNSDWEDRSPITEAAARSDEMEENTPNVLEEEMISLIKHIVEEKGTSVNLEDLERLEFGGIIAHNTSIFFSLSSVVSRAVELHPDLVEQGNVAGLVDFILKTDDYLKYIGDLSPPQTPVQQYAAILTLLQPTLAIG